MLNRIPVYAGIYVAVVAVFLFLESKLVFHPHTAAEAWLPPADRRTRDVEFSSADGTKGFSKRVAKFSIVDSGIRVGLRIGVSTSR